MVRVLAPHWAWFCLYDALCHQLHFQSFSMLLHLDVTIAVCDGYLSPLVTAYVAKHLGNDLRHPLRFSNLRSVLLYGIFSIHFILYSDISGIEFFVRLSPA